MDNLALRDGGNFRRFDCTITYLKSLNLRFMELTQFIYLQSNSLSHVTQIKDISEMNSSNDFGK